MRTGNEVRRGAKRGRKPKPDALSTASRSERYHAKIRDSGGLEFHIVLQADDAAKARALAKARGVTIPMLFRLMTREAS